MRTFRFLFFVVSLALTSGWASAQTTNSAPAPDAAKIAEFEKRFAQGKALEDQGKLLESLAVFDGIIAESPEAKGSLREAGYISLQLKDMTKAEGYFEKLHALVPEYPAAIESLIQINQALKRDVKVALLIKEYRSLYDAGKVPKPYFVREQIPFTGTDKVVFTEYFDYTKSPNIVWKTQILDEAGGVKRQLVLVYDPRATDDLRQKDPKLANAEQFLILEDVLQDGKLKQVDAYFQMFSMPEYKKARNTMLAIFGGAYKPVYTQAVSATGTPPPTN